MSSFDRRLLYFILIYTCVEGLVVNLTFPSKLGFIVKDFAVAMATMSLISSNNGRSFGSLSRITGALGLFAFVQAMYLLFPSENLPIIARLIGLKMRILYIPIMFLGYRYIRTAEDFRTLGIVLITVSIPVSLFGIYLFFAGPAALHQIGGTYSAIVYSTTGVWRVPGTFTSPGQFGFYLTFNALIAMAMLLVGSVGPRLRLLLWGSLAVMLMAMLASGSRTPLLLAVACGGMMIVALGRVGRLVSMSVIMYAVFTIGFIAFGAGVSERVDSIASTEHIERFQRTYFGQLFIDQMMKQPMGIGLGAATIGARHFTEYRDIVFVESYLGLVGIETGLVGLGALLWMCVAIVSNLLRSRSVAASSPAAPGWYACGLFAIVCILLMPVGTHIDSAPANAYFWLSLGICAKLYDLERLRKAAALQGVAEAQPLSPYGVYPQPIPSRFV